MYCTTPSGFSNWTNLSNESFLNIELGREKKQIYFDVVTIGQVSIKIFIKFIYFICMFK